MEKTGNGKSSLVVERVHVPNPTWHDKKYLLLICQVLAFVL